MNLMILGQFDFYKHILLYEMFKVTFDVQIGFKTKHIKESSFALFHQMVFFDKLSFTFYEIGYSHSTR